MSMKTSNTAATGESLITGKSLLRLFFFAMTLTSNSSMLVVRFVKKNSFDRQQQNAVEKPQSENRLL